MTNKDNIKQIAKELGSRGGQTTLKRHGKKHFRNAALRRWEKAKEKEAEDTASFGA